MSSSKSGFRETETETILLAVTGMSPGILTETVWALAQETPPVIPDRVVVITTTIGRKQISDELFIPKTEFGGSTVWEALRKTLAARGHDLTGKLRFGTTPDDLHVFTVGDAKTELSRELDDIRTLADNDAAADFLMERVRQFVENPETTLIASIAGGRKTMSTLLYGCLSLLGRSQDRLLHVLVNEPFEDPRLAPRFCFPASPPITLQIKDRAGSIVSEHKTSDARLDLADVPFVRLRKLFPAQFGKMPGKFTNLVHAYSERIEEMTGQVEVQLDEVRGMATISGRAIPLEGRELPVFAFLVQRAASGRPPLANHDAALEPFVRFLKDWSAKHPNWNLRGWENKCEADDLRKPLSAIRGKIASSGFSQVSEVWFPTKGKGRGRFGIPAGGIVLDDG